MATSGQINTNTTYDSYFWVKWEQSGDQDIANNRTKIAWSCGVYCGHSFHSNAIKMSAVSINGIKVYSGGTYSNYSNGNHIIASGEMWIKHDTDGSKKFSISSFTGWLYSDYNYSSNGGSYTLTQIPRAAALTSTPDFNDHSNPVIKYSNPAGNSATSLMACISLTGGKDDVAYRDVTKTGTSYTFNLTEAERNVLRKATSKNERTVYFYLRTKFGTTKYYSKNGVTFSIVEDEDSKPSITMTTTLDNSSLPDEFNDMVIEGKSRYDISLSAEGKYGATVASLYAVADEVKYDLTSFKTNVFRTSGNIDIVGHVKDTRGFTNSTKETISVIPYSKPLVIPLENQNAILCYRSDGNGVRIGNSTSVWIKAKRTYYSVEGKNQCALQWRRKQTAEEWNDSAHLWKDLIPKTDTDTSNYDALISGEVFDLKKSYTVQIRTIDDIGEYDIKTFDIPTEDVALHLGKGGKNVAVGTYCDYSKPYTFYSEWDAYFDKEVYVKDQKLEDYIINVINNIQGG